jgi:hypothetical protein
MRIDHERRLGIFEDLNRQLPTHGRKVLKEDLQRVSSFKMLEENANRHSRTDEHRSAPENLGIGDDARRMHGWLLEDTEFSAG